LRGQSGEPGQIGGGTQQDATGTAGFGVRIRTQAAVVITANIAANASERTAWRMVRFVIMLVLRSL